MECKCKVVNLKNTEHEQEGLTETYVCPKCGKKTIYEYKLKSVKDI